MLQVDYFEFDLHMTADDILVLSHDATLDRVSDAVTVFGAENVLVRDKTLAELKQLNMAAQFVNDAGETPYADLHGDAVPDELRILSLDEVLDYLTAAGDYRYIIEIKDGGEVGLAAADQLYATLNERDLLDRVIVGSFRDEVADYITANYPDTHRSASPEEVVQFYFAALTGKTGFHLLLRRAPAAVRRREGELRHQSRHRQRSSTSPMRTILPFSTGPSILRRTWPTSPASARTR